MSAAAVFCEPSRKAARSARTISRHSSSIVTVARQPSLARGLGGIADQQIHFGRAEIARVDAHQHAAGSGANALFVDAAPAPFERRCRPHRRRVEANSRTVWVSPVAST